MSERTSELRGVFQSWNIKLRRADEHLSWIETEYQWFRQASSYRLASEFDNETRKNVFFVEHMNTVPIKWSAVIGECVNGYRAALDHVVYAIAERRGKATDKTEFPIFVDPEKYKLARRQKIGGLDDEAQTIIDLAQPKTTSDALWLLHDLANLDKHHRIHLTTTVLAGSRLRIHGHQVDFPVGHTFEAGTVLASFGDDDLRAWGFDPKSINAEMDMQFEFAFDVTFSDARAATGRQVRASLVSIRQVVADLIGRLQPLVPDERPRPT